MAGYMDGYGVQDARREKIRNRILIGLLIAAVCTGVLYFTFRDYREQERVKLFVQLLREKKHEEAYRLWGCLPEKPCRDYSYQRFLEDWGPSSSHSNASEMQIGAKRSCSAGIIQTINFKSSDLNLWVDRADLTIGFAPWPVCNPRIPTPAAP